MRKRTDRNKNNDIRQKNNRRKGNNRREYGKETARTQQETGLLHSQTYAGEIPNYSYETRLKLRVSGKKGDKQSLIAVLRRV
jgi:hypothetical protein